MLNEPSQEPKETKELRRVSFPTFARGEEGAPLNPNAFAEIPIQVSVDLGSAKLSLKEVTELQEGAIIELGRLVGEPLTVKVGNQVIAQGEVVTVDDHYGIRVTQVSVRT